MIFRRKKSEQDPALHAALLESRTKALLSLEGDLETMGWDRLPRYYQMFDYNGEEILALKNEVPDKPVSFLVGRTYSMGVEAGVIGCAFAFEGWAYPEGVTKETCKAPPAQHPNRREVRVVTSHFKDGMSISIERFRDTGQVRVLDMKASDSREPGAIVKALQFSIGMFSEPDDEMKAVVAKEMQDFLKEHVLDGPHSILSDPRFMALYKDITALLNNNANDGALEACIRSHARNLDMAEDELVALAKMTGLI